MFLTKRRRSSSAASLAVLYLLFGHPVAGQELEPSPPPTPQVISILEVAERAEALARELRQMRVQIAPVEEIEAIANAFDERTATLLAKREELDSRLDDQPTLGELGEQEREWTREGDGLASWRRALTRRAAALETEVAQLKAAEAAWSVTFETAAAGQAPAEVLDVIRRSLSEVVDVYEAASRRRSEVLALQNRISQQELVVSATLDQIRDARAGLRSRLFEPDAPPIWSALNRDAASAGETIASAFAASQAVVQEFLVERQTRLLTLGVFFVLAWIGALGLKHSIAARQAAGGEIADSSRVFRRPIALALLLTLLSLFWLFPLAPEALVNVVGLLLLIPMFRLLPSLMHPGFRPILYGVAVFYVVDRFRDVLGGAPLEGRVVFALECVAAALFCLALLRPSRLKKIPDPGGFPRWPGRAVRLGFVVFAIASVANLLGYVSLAKVLGEGLLTSIYIAIGLYAAVRVIGIVIDVSTKTAWAQKIRFLRARRGVAVGWIKSGISILATGLWAYWSLGALAIQDAVISRARVVLTTPFTLGTASISLGDVLALGLTITVAIVLSRVVRFVLLEDVFTRVRTARGIPHAVSATAHYVILFCGFLLALAAAGIDFSKFTLLAGAFGVGIGFGLQNVVNNFVSGLILLYERPIQVGDTIDMGDLIGQVRRIGIRSSTVRTLTGAEVIVPNADLVSQRVINWTLSDKTRRIDVPIGVKYGTDPGKVLQILASVAETHERVLKYPAPVALFRGHGESSLDFELRVWIANFDHWFEVESEVNTAINRALGEADIEIPFPQRDLHLRSVDADAARKLARAEDGT